VSIDGKISIKFCGRGYFTFHFETKEDRDLIFRNGPYFMDTRGLYLNKWTLDFDPEMDVPNDAPFGSDCHTFPFTAGGTIQSKQ